MGAGQGKDVLPDDDDEAFHDAVGEIPQRVKLYAFMAANGGVKRNRVVDSNVQWKFVNFNPENSEDSDEDEEEDEDRQDEAKGHESFNWHLKISDSKAGKTIVSARVDLKMASRFHDDEFRFEFVKPQKVMEADVGVWTLRFPDVKQYKLFGTSYQKSLFENQYQADEENKVKLVGQDFVDWIGGKDADEEMWDAEEDDIPPPEEIKESMNVNTPGKSAQGLTMGALENSFLLHDSGVDVFKNLANGVSGKGSTITLTPKGRKGGESFSTPKKGLLMRAETTMMVMSPGDNAMQSCSGLRQLDLEAGKIVSEWRFEKDGTPICMKDVTGDSKDAQLEASQATFLGLDDNRLCRWDMRDKHGIVQEIASPALQWSAGHQFARGTNFQCFASTGTGCIAVGSRDGKVRMYSTTSMRQAKSVFPSLGSPITNIDVTFDGRWVLATTDKHLALIYTMFKDKNGLERCAFETRVGGRLASPRLLRLTPRDAALARADYKFQGGQFSWVTEQGKYERNIVVTAKEYTVVWNFRRVKQNDHFCYTSQAEGLKSCTCYKIVPRKESVVASKFMHENFTGASSEVPLVVATPHDVSSLCV